MSHVCSYNRGGGARRFRRQRANGALVVGVSVLLDDDDDDVGPSSTWLFVRSTFNLIILLFIFFYTNTSVDIKMNVTFFLFLPRFTSTGFEKHSKKVCRERSHCDLAAATATQQQAARLSSGGARPGTIT